MRPPLLIVNPACGTRGGARALNRAFAAVERTLGDVHIRYTSRRGHARQLAMQAVREDHQLVVAVGGDGTFSEVANGVLMAEDFMLGNTGTRGAGAAVGLIDMGTGGDFRRSLGIGAGPEACLEALSSGRERLVDVGKATFAGPDGQPLEQYFVNVLSAGLGGLVDRYVEAVPAFLGGRAGYYLASVRAVGVAKEQPLLATVTWDDEVREETLPVYVMAICNGRWFGGGMDIAPMASLDDGRFEVLTITEHSRLALAAKIRKVYSGRHLEEPTVGHFPCRRIELRLADTMAERRFLLDVDGDALGSLPLTVEVVPGRLRVRA